MPDSKHTDFLCKNYDSYNDIFKHELEQLSAISLDLVDGFGIPDEELVTVLGKKS